MYASVSDPWSLTFHMKSSWGAIIGGGGLLVQKLRYVIQSNYQGVMSCSHARRQSGRHIVVVMICWHMLPRLLPRKLQHFADLLVVAADSIFTWL